MQSLYKINDDRCVIDSLERRESKKNRRFSELTNVYTIVVMKLFSSHDWPPFDAWRMSIVYNCVCCHSKRGLIYSRWFDDAAAFKILSYNDDIKKLLLDDISHNSTSLKHRERTKEQPRASVLP